MDTKNLKITNHAKNRFTERFFKLHPRCNQKSFNWKRRLTELLVKAKPAKTNLNSYLNRIERHDNKNTEYYETGGWRFVIIYNEDLTERSLVTVERRNPNEN